MRISSIEIKNYRLLQNAILDLDAKTTVIVGRNNTGKTSLLHLLNQILGNKPLVYNDFPIAVRSKALNLFIRFLMNEISVDDCAKYWPTTSLKFFVDYSAETADEDLGALSPFIIDLDDELARAVIKAEYKLIVSEDTKKLFAEQISQLSQDRTNHDAIEAIKKTFSENFSDFFTLKVFAVYPEHPQFSKEQTLAALKDLLVIYSIPAERALDESGVGQSSLNGVIEEYFKKDIVSTDPQVQENISKLQTSVEAAGKNLQKVTTEILDDLIDKTVGFGYPSEYDMKIGVTTDLSLSQQFINNSKLNYWDEKTSDKLPSDYNGLGYKNLIKIQFLLAQFTKDFRAKGPSCLFLLFVEEPESHMHPQMQQRFVDYLDEYLQKLLGDNNIQSIITTHSSHIANEVGFDQIRYAKRDQAGTRFKDLGEFIKKASSNADFVHKYLTLTKCDLFFADKAILVEGASERILLPDMIDKCSNTETSKLKSQYYTIIEVGGAYAHRFMPFMRFIGIPCLIITDIDPERQEETTNKYGVKKLIWKACSVNNGERSSNETINYWVRSKKELALDVAIAFKDINNLSAKDKEVGCIRLAFQIQEQNLCGRSLEEAIINSNRSIYNLPNDAKEDDIAFDKQKSKTDFALDLILNHSDYQVPEYIKEGLSWLNDQKIIS